MKIIKKTGDVYVFLDEVKQDLTFSFTDSKSLPGQTIELQYYADNPIPWAAEYSSTKKLRYIIYKSGHGSIKRTSTTE
jgi:hypothetical protein